MNISLGNCRIEARTELSLHLGAPPRRLEGRSLRDAGAEIEAEQRQDRTDEEGHAPAPGEQGVGGQRSGRHARDGRGGQHRQADRDLLGRGREGAVTGGGVFVQERDGDLVFAAGRETLQQSCRDDDQRRRDADLRIGRAERDDEAAEARHDDRDREQRTTPIGVGQWRQDEGADRPSDEADGESREACDQRRRGAFGGKHLAGEHSGQEAVDGPVEPFDEVADGAADQDAAAPDLMRSGALGAADRRVCRSWCGSRECWLGAPAVVGEGGEARADKIGQQARGELSK